MKEQKILSTVVNQTELPKIGYIKVQVPFHKPGNVVEHLLVEFVIFGNGTDFKAVPLRSEENQRILNLPSLIDFKVTGGRPITKINQYNDIVVDIVEQLSSANLYPPLAAE